MNDDIPSPSKILFWIVLFLIALSVVGFGLNAADLIGSTIVERHVVEESRQYAETNTDAFYKTLAAVKEIDVQLADPNTSDAVRAGLQDQKDFYENEMRRQVAKIPVDARTADMVRYGGHR